MYRYNIANVLQFETFFLALVQPRKKVGAYFLKPTTPDYLLE